MLYFVTRGRAFQFYQIMGKSKGLTATTITITTTTFNTKNTKPTANYHLTMILKC